MVMLGNEKRALAHIMTDTVKFTAMNAQTTLVGTVSANENNVATIAARVKGRIDQLFIRQQGERIVNGQALYSIYSEELLADQNDYLSTVRQLKKFPGQTATIKKND